MNQKILVISDRALIDTGGPGDARLVNMVKQLSLQFEIELLHLHGEQSIPLSIVENSRIHYTRIQPRGYPRSLPRRIIHSIGCYQPHDLTWRNPIAQSELSLMIRNHFETKRCAGIFAMGLSVAQYISQDIRDQTVLDVIDAPSLVARTKSGLARTARDYINLVIAYLSAKLEERFRLRHFRHLVAVGERDVDVLKRAGNVNALHISNGVDSEYFSPEHLQDGAEGVVFFGVLGYAPNYEAATFLMADIAPEIRTISPGISISILGGPVDDTLSSLATATSVTLAGTVDDIRSYFTKRTITIIPLKRGAGVKNKVLVALALGSPVVASSVAVDGMNLTSGIHYLEANSPAEYAYAVKRLLDDRELFTRLSDEGRKRVKDSWSWEVMADKLARLFSSQ